MDPCSIKCSLHPEAAPTRAGSQSLRVPGARNQHSSMVHEPEREQASPSPSPAHSCGIKECYLLTRASLSPPEVGLAAFVAFAFFSCPSLCPEIAVLSSSGVPCVFVCVSCMYMFTWIYVSM